MSIDPEKLEPTMNQSYFLATTMFLTCLFTSSLAEAYDRCKFATHVSGQSEDSQFIVELSYDKTNNQWLFESFKQNKSFATGKIPQLKTHAHPEVFVSPAADRFVVFDPTATTRLEDRVIVFKFDGTLVKSYGLGDLLTDDEQRQIQRTRSHLHWTVIDEKRGRAWLTKGGKSLSVNVVGGRTLSISLDNSDQDSNLGK
jgi:hypothetical protein